MTYFKRLAILGKKMIFKMFFVKKDMSLLCLIVYYYSSIPNTIIVLMDSLCYEMS